MLKILYVYGENTTKQHRHTKQNTSHLIAMGHFSTVNTASFCCDVLINKKSDILLPIIANFALQE